MLLHGYIFPVIANMQYCRQSQDGANVLKRRKNGVKIIQIKYLFMWPKDIFNINVSQLKW